ncbi:MAG: O-antigen ligase family protein, partial [Clostridia bacterium]|nr:O-antigen ligase family protein [Clostridia bacterium]
MDAAVLGTVLAVVAAAPGFRGLFFRVEQLLAVLVLLVAFALFWPWRHRAGRTAFLRSPLDWAACGLLVAYVLATFTAAEPRAAVQEDLKVLLYFLAYWLVRNLATTDARRVAVLGTLAAAAGFVAVAGVGVAAGSWRYTGAFVGGRIYSTLQYPNSTAAYLTMGVAAALALWTGWVRTGWSAGDWRRTLLAPWPSYVALAVAYASFFTFVYTYSRGAWLLFPVAALLLVALLPAGQRLAAVLGLAALGAAFLAAGTGFPEAAARGDGAAVWTSLLAGVPVALIANALVLALGRLPGRVRGALVALGGLAALAVGAVTAVRVSLPASILARLGQISLEDYSAWSRLQWTLDGLGLVARRPLLGAGGGGWNALYHTVQSYGYFSTEAHNHFVQVWIEAGSIGLAAFLAMWVFLVSRLVSALRARGSGGRAVTARTVAAGAATGAVALGLHSAIDFNLSLGAVSLALWTCFGLVEAALSPLAEGGDPANEGNGAANRAERRRGDARPSVTTRYLPAAAAGAVGLFVASLLTGTLLAQTAASALQRRDFQAARAGYERALAFDPLAASLWIDLGQTLEALARQRGGTPAGNSGEAPDGAGGEVPVGTGEGADVLLRRADDAFRRGVALAPYNADYRVLRGAFLLRRGRVEEGVAELERAVELHPWGVQRYEALAEGLVAAAEALILAGRGREAGPLLDRVQALPAVLANRHAAVPPQAAGVYPFPADTPVVAAAVGRASALRGDLSQAAGRLRQALDGGG